MALKQDSSDPTGVVAISPDSAVGAARARKANSAIQLRIAGASWDEVAMTLGYPDARAAQTAIEVALDRHVNSDPKTKARMRQLAGQRLERLLRGVWAKATNPEHPDQLPAVKEARMLISEYSKTFGLNEPTEVVLHSPSMNEIDAWVNKVLALSAPPMEEADVLDADIVEDEPLTEQGE